MSAMRTKLPLKNHRARPEGQEAKRPPRQTVGLPLAKRGGSGAAKSVIWQFGFIS